MMRNGNEYVNVFPDLIATPPEPMLILEEGKSLKVSCESSQDIFIENSNEDVVGLVTRRQKTGTRARAFVLDYEAMLLRTGDSGIIACVSKVNNITLHEWSFNVIPPKGKIIFKG